MEEHEAAQKAMSAYRNIRGFLDPSEGVRDYVGDALRRIRQMMMDLEPHERDAIAADLKLKAQAARARADRLKAGLVQHKAVRDAKIAEAQEVADKYANIARVAHEEEQEISAAAEKAYKVAAGIEEDYQLQLEEEEDSGLEKQDSVEKLKDKVDAFEEAEDVAAEETAEVTEEATSEPAEEVAAATKES